MSVTTTVMLNIHCSVQALFNGMRLDKNPPRRLAVEGLYYDEVKEEKPEFPTMYLLKVNPANACGERHVA